MMVPPQIPEVPFTWSGARKAGVTRHRLDLLLESGVVRRVLHGVYQRTDTPDTTLNRARAASLVISPFGVACERTAAWLHGVDVFDYSERDFLPSLETFVLRGHARIERRGCAGGERDLLARDVCLVLGVKCTTPLRTALDLGCSRGRRDALAVLDAFMRLKGITHADMRRELPRYFRRRGVVQLRELVPLADPRAESPGESWTRLAIIDAGLPTPQPQYWVVHEGREIFRLDLAYPGIRVAVEYDGQDFHTTPEQRRHDLRRRRWLRDHGWTVIVVDKDSFTPEALSAWLDELRTALRAARRVGLRGVA